MNYPNKVSTNVYQDDIISFISVAHLKENANLYLFFISWALYSFIIELKLSLVAFWMNFISQSELLME